MFIGFPTVSEEKILRTGLVLGAGGVLGGAWMAGALQALADRTRWYPRQADHIIGTSAGSVLAVLGAAGVPPWLLIPENAGNVYHGIIDAGGNLEINRDLWERIVRRRRLGLPRLTPGSLALTLAGIRQGKSTLLKALSGLAPVGCFSTDPIKDTVRWVAPAGGWVDHPNCWVVACDYQTGERVVFGRDAGLDADVPQAVAASCAIPGYYSPELIGKRRFVDGGLHSMLNMDLLQGLGLDLVIVLSSLSSRGRGRVRGVRWDPMNHLTEVTRRAVARQLDTEAELLRSQGTQVMVLEPTPEDLEVIGVNIMDETRRGQVMAAATRSVGRFLERPELRSQLAAIEQPAASRLRPAI